MTQALPEEGRVQLERAVGSLARLLIPGESADMQPALEELLRSTSADAVLIDRVEFDLVRGAVLVPVVQAALPGVEYVWTEFVMEPHLVQYSSLMAGEIWIVPDTQAPDAPDREKYLGLDPPIRSELAIPIFDDSIPVGLLSFLFGDSPHNWTAGEIEALTTAAAIIEVIWARRRGGGGGEKLLAERYRSFLVTEALVACSQALLLESDAEAVGRALQAVLVASEAAGVYIDENVEDPALGLMMVCRHSALSEVMGSGVFAGFFDPIPWSELPDEFEILAAGGMYVSDLSTDPRSDRLFEWEGIRAELAVPILIDGEWIFTVGVVDVVPRTWTPEQRRLIETVAAMFGAYWTRESVESKLRKTIQSRDEFVASVSHELRTPLAAVVGFASELRDAFDEFDDPTRIDLIRLIARQAGDVSFLVDDLLVAARSQQASLSLVPAMIDLATEVKSTLAGLPPEYAEDVIVEVDGMVTAWADGRRVRQIIRNLVLNARKYGGPECVVRLRSEKRIAVIEVRDDGPGVPVALRDRMFEAYSSGGNEAGSLPSMGLGLTVSRQLVERMHGSIGYRFDGKSVFEIRLPERWSVEIVE